VRFTIILTVLTTVIVTLVTVIALGKLLGPYTAQYHSASGIPYTCAFESQEDFVLVTLDNHGDYDEQENDQR